jgi:CRP-like cAMP-binding protein
VSRYDAGVPPPGPRLLSAVPLFRGLDEGGLRAAAADARLVRVAAGRTFFREGERARVFYVVHRGRVKFTQVSAEGHEVILRVIGPGEPFGGVAAFVEDATYPVTARALDTSEAHAWDGARILGLMHRFPTIAINAARMIADRLHELQRQHRELMTERVEQRIARALVRLADHAGRRIEGGVEIDFPLSRQDLAQMTGTTLFTVSRTLSAWQETGLIATGRRRVVIRQPHRLVRIAEDLPS